MLADDRNPSAVPAVELPASARSFATASSEMLAAILDQSLDCIKVIGPTGKLDFMNRNGRCAMEIDDFAAVAGRDWWDLWPDESAHLVRNAVDRARTGVSDRFEAFCPTAKGTPRWWEVSVSPLMDGDGEMRGIVSVSRDITERVRARELREAAAAEMRHRLQNAYTLASAIVVATAKGTPEREAFGQEIAMRLERLGVAQALLLQVDQATLPQLVSRLAEPFGEQCELRIGALPEVLLGEDDVRALALALGELFTNSNKYGALGHGGTIGIAAEDGDGRLQLVWQERCPSGHCASPAQGHGSGHRLVQRALAARGGTFEIDWVEHGLDARMTLPGRTA